LSILENQEKGNLVSARKHILDVYNEALKKNYQWAVGDSLYLLGLIEEYMGQTLNALKYYDQAADIKTRISDPKIAEIQQAIKALTTQYPEL
jgi:hypothetical protein